MLYDYSSWPSCIAVVRESAIQPCSAPSDYMWFIWCVSQSVQLVTSIVLPTINSYSFFSSGSSFIFPDDFFHNSLNNFTKKNLSAVRMSKKRMFLFSIALLFLVLQHICKNYYHLKLFWLKYLCWECNRYEIMVNFK